MNWIFFTIALIVVTFIHVYVIGRTVYYFGNIELRAIFFLGIFAYCCGFFLLRVFHEVFPSNWHHLISDSFNVLLAPIFFAIPMVLVIDGILVLLWLMNKAQILPSLLAWVVQMRIVLASGFVGVLAMLVVVGHIKFLRDIEVVNIDISSSKVSREYLFLHITDLQFGTVSSNHVNRISRKIHGVLKTKPIDFIINTGDQTDTANYQPQDIDLKLQSKNVFFSLGNHEFYHGLERTLKILTDQGYSILRNDHKIFEELNIIGIDDSNNVNQVEKILSDTDRKLIDERRYNILAYHRPRGVQSAKKAGIDLMLSGHTHGGQVFPYTWLLNWIYDVPSGLTRLEDFYIFVGDGMGLWGPRMRLGSRNQIAIIHITPQLN